VFHQHRDSRAGDGIRTHDILLGKQTLCQLSYTRLLAVIIAGGVLPVYRVVRTMAGLLA
jgi:hypothetical protein